MPTPASRPHRSRPRRTAVETLLRGLAAAKPPRGTKKVRDTDPRPCVHFLILHGYGLGGTIRTTINTANYLADHGWQVEIVSLLRRRDQPVFALDPRIRLTPLVDNRPGKPRRFRPGHTRLKAALADRLEAHPSVLCPEQEYAAQWLTLWSDLLLLRKLRSLPPGVLVSTRVVLNLVAARFAPAHLVTLGQEHLNFAHHPADLRDQLSRYYPRLDALSVLTAEDEKDYRDLLSTTQTRVVRIPNALPELGAGVSDLTESVVVAVGRLTPQKGFDLLLRAFAQVHERHPDWELRIFGKGKDQARLSKLVNDLGLRGRARLMGPTDRIGPELARASIYALSSRFEGFGMVIIEAMSKGLPVVSFDCPRGPREIITHGVDGLLVPNGDIDALAQGITTLIEDDQLRHKMGTAAQGTASAYTLAQIGPQWETLLHQLWTATHARSHQPLRPTAR